VLTKRLVDAGLVSTRRNAKDKRQVNIVMTEKGKDIFAQTQPVIKNMNNNVIQALSEDNTLLLTKFLRVILDNAKAGLAKIVEEKQKSTR
jgi:DNA-binding MarR family transcriptional regulator